MNKPAGRPWRNWLKIGLAVGVFAGLYASYAVIFLPQKDRVGSQHQTKSYPKDQKQTCMEVSIYDSVPFEAMGSDLSFLTILDYGALGIGARFDFSTISNQRLLL